MDIFRYNDTVKKTMHFRKGALHMGGIFGVASKADCSLDLFLE